MTHKEREQQWKARIEAYKASGLNKEEALNEILPWSTTLPDCCRVK